MMAGVVEAGTKQPILTKQRFVELAATPDKILFYQSNQHGEVIGKAFRGSQTPLGLILTVLGPRPSATPGWWATVSLQYDKLIII